MLAFEEDYSLLENDGQAEAQMAFNQWNENKEKYVILDTETTGLYDSEIVDIAVIDLYGNTLFNSLVKPFNPIPSKATEIHGITNEMVKDSPNWLEVWKDLYSVLKGKEILIYNKEFDIRLIHESFKPYYNAENRPPSELLTELESLRSDCVMITYAELLQGFGARWVKLGEACGHYTDHRALGDCLATLEVIKKCYNPGFRKIDFERIYIKRKHNKVKERIQEIIYEIEVLTDELNDLNKEKDNLVEVLAKSDKDFLEHVESEKEIETPCLDDIFL